MGNVRRVYVEKKPDFAVKAKELKHEVKHYLGIAAEGVRVLIRYDVENVSDDTYKKALQTVFSEPPVDDIYEEEFDAKGGKVFSVEFLPGQFDQRADSAEQCVKLLNEEEEPIIRSATTYVINGDITEDELEAIKKYCINPVDSRETGAQKPETLVQNFEEPADVAIFDGFIDMAEAQLKELYDSLNLAMTFKDFLHIQNYFKGEEKRNPSMTEIRVLDTYWSDHCRHTTFSTELKNVKFDEGFYQAPIKKTYEDYLNTHKEMYKGRDDKFVCLMDLALLAMKRLKAEGKLDDQEESDEINACSIVVPGEIDGKTEDVMKLEPLADKWASFGFIVKTIDGNNIKEICEAIDFALANETDKPVMIIMDTVKGCGIDFMEGNYKWHYGALDDEHYELAKASLEKHYQKRLARVEKEAE